MCDIASQAMPSSTQNNLSDDIVGNEGSSTKNVKKAHSPMLREAIQLQEDLEVWSSLEKYEEITKNEERIMYLMENALTGKFKKLRKPYLLTLGIAHKQTFNLERAADLFTEVRKICTIQQDHEGTSVACLEIGECCFTLGQLARAIQELERCCSVAREEGLKGVEAEAWMWLGQCYQETFNWERAIEFHQKRYAYMQEAKNIHGTLRAQHDIAVCYYGMQAFWRACSVHEESLILCETEENQTNEMFKANVLKHLGLCYGQCGNYECAKEMVWKSMMIMHKCEDEIGTFLCCMHLGDISFMERDYEEACANYQQAKKRMECLKAIPSTYVQLLFKLAICYHKNGNNEKAMNLEKMGVEILNGMKKMKVSSPVA